ELRPGDFLISRANTRKLVGDVAVVGNCRPRLMLCDLIYRLRLRESEIDPHYLLLILRSPLGRRQIKRDARGSSETMVKITGTHIRRWQIALPSLSEQRRMVKWASDQVKGIDDAIARATRELSLLHEYRTRVTSDIVTGKFDVRGIAL